MSMCDCNQGRLPCTCKGEAAHGLQASAAKQRIDEQAKPVPPAVCEFAVQQLAALKAQPSGLVPAGWRIDREGNRIVVQGPYGGYAAVRQGHSGIAESILYCLADAMLSLNSSPVSDGEPVYQFQCREIGEGGFEPYDYSRYLYCQQSPEHDTRVVQVALSAGGVDERAAQCDHQWTDDGLHLLVCTSCGAQEDHDPHWRDMATAPRDGTMVRLLVEFTEHATEDADQAPTIGANNFDNDGEDRWQFAGWCWSHDHFVEGKGEPVGWLPMIEARAALSAPSHGEQVREGWKLVPFEPNEAIRDAIDLLCDDHSAFEDSDAFWSYLLAATPSAGSQEQA